MDSIEARVTQIERHLGLRPPGAEERKKPVNQVAFDLAFEAWVNGDRKPMDEYCRHYRVPTATT